MKEKRKSKPARTKTPAHAIIGEFAYIDLSGEDGLWALDVRCPQHADGESRLSDFVAEMRAEVEAAKTDAPEHGPARTRLEAADLSLRTFEEIQEETEAWLAEAPALRPYFEWLLHRHFVAIEARNIARLCRSELVSAAASEHARLMGLQEAADAVAINTKAEWDREAALVRASGARLIKSKVTGVVADRLGIDARTVERQCARAEKITASLALP